jgi:hypothetical protein
VFRNVMATCNRHGQCYVRNDGNTALTGQLSVMLIHFGSGEVIPVGTHELGLPPGVSLQACIGMCPFTWIIFTSFLCESLRVLLNIRVVRMAPIETLEKCCLMWFLDCDRWRTDRMVLRAQRAATRRDQRCH